MSTPTQNEAQAQAKANELILAYAQVFGMDHEHRTPAQRLVWADMEHRGYIRRSTMIPDGNGQQCEHRMQSAEGQRIFVLNTQVMVQRARTLTQEPKKPRVRKGKTTHEQP